MLQSEVRKSDKIKPAQPKKRLLRSLFPTWEMEQYPKKLLQAIEHAERHDSIRKQLHTSLLANIDELAKTRPRLRYGRLGLDQLPISDLAKVEEHEFVKERKLPAALLSTESEKDIVLHPSIRESMTQLISEIESVTWLSDYEKKGITHIFILNIANRFDVIDKLIFPQLSVDENRNMAIKIFEEIRIIKNDVLAIMFRLKKRMSKAGIFDEDLNSERLISKMYNTDIIGRAELSLKRGNRRYGFILGADDLYHDLEMLIKPQPKLQVDNVIVEYNNKIRQEELGKLQDESAKEAAARLLRRQLVMTPVEETQNVSPEQKEHMLEIASDLTRLINAPTNDNDEASSVIWSNDKQDPHEITAKDILKYEEHQIPSFASCIAEDPILLAHQELSTITSKILPRYLKNRSMNVKFDFNALLNTTKNIELKDQEEINSRAEEIIGQKNKKVRKFKSRVSDRTPKDYIVISENDKSDINSISREALGNSASLDLLGRLVANVDANLSRFKEVEELYTEIMKSVDKNKVERDDEQEHVYACPAAPAEHKIEDYFGISRTLCIRPYRPMAVKREDSAKIPTSANVMLRLHRRNLHADQFRRNRNLAMRKTISSKFNYKYNFGGYIPSNMYKKSKKHNVVTVDGFDEFVASVYSDFIPMLVYQDKRERERQQELEEQEKILSMNLEEERLEKQKEQERLERIEKIFNPQKNHWNAEVLDYIAGFTNPQPEPKKYIRADGRIENMQDDNIEEFQAKPEMDTNESQKELESLWVTLQMPIDQKLDMAIKYGSHKYAKLDNAIKLWKQASELIIEREKLLEEIEAFEMASSDPARFFAKGQMEARFKEAEHREKLLRPLHTLDAKIKDIASVIKNELSETVTFKGAPYVEKMKRDYADILRKCKKYRASLKQEAGL
ncbi:Coiled-coil domain-containing protein 87 [Boothiomyces macroporosus]|uniref:Coiled-coil domain-containing protein 87 n=1 Tax=Boothiomyces macroporosus TaxID=261099 RepID=A0AAD5UGK1_9FUNG|nr:Coiled-coil domain-containing protein 87 [Boothiomyces macroporosus]